MSVLRDLQGRIRESVGLFRHAVTGTGFLFQGVLEARSDQGVSEAIPGRRDGCFEEAARSDEGVSEAFRDAVRAVKFPFRGVLQGISEAFPESCDSR